MAVDISAFTNFLGGFFGPDADENQVNDFNNNPGGVLAEAGFGDATAIDVNQAVTRLAETNQGNQSFTSQGGAANFAGSGVVNLPPPPPAYEAYEASGNGGGLEGAIESIQHYTSVYNTTEQSFEDNDTTVINDQDTNVDNSINQDITAFGDVNQDFDQDNDVVTGDDNALANDGGVANSGDGAVVAGDDIDDATIVTGGNVGGSVTGDVEDSIVGDGNTAIIDSDVDGPVAFGGDAIDAENVAQGGSTIQEDIDGDANANTGSGTQTVVQDSELDESAVGGSQVQSNDVDIDADDGSAVAFGSGSEAEGNEIESTNFGGTTQIAGDESTQLGQTDNSVDIEDSFQQDNSVDESIEIEDSFTIDDSFTADESFNEDNDTTTDDDLVDLG